MEKKFVIQYELDENCWYDLMPEYDSLNEAIDSIKGLKDGTIKMISFARQPGKYRMILHQKIHLAQFDIEVRE